jgi:hypothetical protein
VSVLDFHVQVKLDAIRRSPTPYDALCLGVPYINPILDVIYFTSLRYLSTKLHFQWDKNDPTNRDKWSGQQGMLKDFDPPYVYNVFRGDKEGFIKAIKDALANPIERSSYLHDISTLFLIFKRETVIF